jgi:hypothetical protein
MPGPNCGKSENSLIVAIPIERISEEEAAKLAKLSLETEYEGIPWRRLRTEMHKAARIF